MTNYYNGISFPFRFGVGGGTSESVLTYEIQDRIYQSIQQIIFTRVGERVNNPRFGSRIMEYNFESYDDINTLALIKFEVERAIAEHEPRVEIIEVRPYTDTEAEGTIFISVTVLISQFATEATFEYQMSTSNNNT